MADERRSSWSAEARRGELREVSFELIGAACAARSGQAGRWRSRSSTREPTAAARSRPRRRRRGADRDLAGREFEAHVAQRALEGLIEQRASRRSCWRGAHDRLARLRSRAWPRRRLGFASDVTAVLWDGRAAWRTRGAYGDKLIAEYDFPGKDVHVAAAARRASSPPLRRGSGARAGAGAFESTWRRRRAPSTSATARSRTATSTSPRPTSCSRSAAASRTRTTSRASRSWPRGSARR